MGEHRMKYQQSRSKGGAEGLVRKMQRTEGIHSTAARRNLKKHLKTEESIRNIYLEILIRIMFLEN